MAEKNYFLSENKNKKVRISMAILNKTPKNCYEELNISKSTFMSVLNGRQKSARIEKYFDELIEKAKNTLEKELRDW